MPENLHVVLAFYGIFIISGTFHEVLHGWSAFRLGDSTAHNLGRINLNPLAHIDPIGTVLFPLINLFYGGFLIGWMKPVPVVPWNLRNPRKDFLLVSLAGPFANIFLGATGVLIASVLPFSLKLSYPVVVRFMEYWITINFFLAIFNLLPIPPLDGSSIVDFVRKDARESYHSQGFLGIIVLYAILFSGGFRLIGQGVVFVAVFLLSHPLFNGVLLSVLLGLLLLFLAHTAPRTKTRRSPPANQELKEHFERARRIAGLLRRGEEISPSDREILEALKRDRGDGKPLCSSLSFHERNSLCPPCPNFKRCLLRFIEEKRK